MLSAIEDLDCRWGISRNIDALTSSRYLCYILTMHIKMMHKQEQQMNSEQTDLHLSLIVKERPEEVFYNIDLYVIIRGI